MHDHDVIYETLTPYHISVHEKGYLCLSVFPAERKIRQKMFGVTNKDKGLEYKSPEFIFEKVVNKESDWYSLGVIM